MVQIEPQTSESIKVQVRIELIERRSCNLNGIIKCYLNKGGNSSLSLAWSTDEQPRNNARSGSYQRESNAYGNQYNNSYKNDRNNTDN